MAAPSIVSLDDSCSAHTSWQCRRCDGIPEITATVSWGVCRRCLTSRCKSPAASNKIPISGRNGIHLPSRHSYALRRASGLNPLQFADPCKFSRQQRPRVNRTITSLCNTGTADLSSAKAAAPGRGAEAARAGSLPHARYAPSCPELSAGADRAAGTTAVRAADQPDRLPERGLPPRQPRRLSPSVQPSPAQPSPEAAFPPTASARHARKGRDGAGTTQARAGKAAASRCGRPMAVGGGPR